MDQSDLDFGLYRVMHTKSAELSQIARRWSRPAESRQRQRRKRRFRRRGRCSRARGLKLEPPGLQRCWRDAGLCSRTAMPRTQFRQADNRLFLVSQRKSRRPGIPSAIGASAQKGETGPSSANASSQARKPPGRGLQAGLGLPANRDGLAFRAGRAIRRGKRHRTSPNPAGRAPPARGDPQRGRPVPAFSDVPPVGRISPARPMALSS